MIMANLFFNAEQITGIIKIYKKIRDEIMSNDGFDKNEKLVILYVELLNGFINFLETKSHLGISESYIKKCTDELKDVGNAVTIHTQYMISYKQIIEGKNLEYHRKQVEGAIKKIDDNIETQKQEGRSTKHFERIRSRLFLLQIKLNEKN